MDSINLKKQSRMAEIRSRAGFWYENGCLSDEEADRLFKADYEELLEWEKWADLQEARAEAFYEPEEENA